MKYTTLCYIEKDGKYLMLYRNKKKKDANEGKWLGVGGHFLPSETKEECLLREVYEETGLKLKDYMFRGTLHFYIDATYEVSYLFTSNDFEGDLVDCDEGILKWVPKTQVFDLKLWEGDYLFLNRLLEDKPYFEMKLIYKNNQLVEYEIKE